MKEIAIALGITLAAMAAPLQQATAAPGGVGADKFRMVITNSNGANAQWSTCPDGYQPDVPCTQTYLSAGAGRIQVAGGSWLTGHNGNAPGNTPLNELSSYAYFEQYTITVPADSWYFGGSNYEEPTASSHFYGFDDDPEFTSGPSSVRLDRASLSADFLLRDCLTLIKDEDGYDVCAPLPGTASANIEWTRLGPGPQGYGKHVGQPEEPECNDGFNFHVFHLDLVRIVDATATGSVSGVEPLGTSTYASIRYDKFAAIDINQGCRELPMPQITFTHEFVPDDESGCTGTFVMDYDFADAPATTALTARVTHSSSWDQDGDPNTDDWVSVSEDSEVRVPTPAGTTAGSYHFEVPVTAVADGDPATYDAVTVQVFHDVKQPIRGGEWYFTDYGNYYNVTESGATCSLDGPF